MGFFIKEWKKRLDPEALAVGTTIAALAYLTFPIQLGLNVALYETLSGIPAEYLALMAVGVFAGAQIATGFINAKMIEKYGYCADIHTTAPYIALGLARGVAVGTMINAIWGSVVNPNDWYAWGNVFSKIIFDVGDPSIAGVNLISKSLLFFGFTNSFNLWITVVKNFRQ